MIKDRKLKQTQENARKAEKMKKNKMVGLGKREELCHVVDHSRAHRGPNRARLGTSDPQLSSKEIIRDAADFAHRL